MDKGKKSTDTKPPVEDEASRSGEDTGLVELSKASLEAIAEIVASKLRVDPLRASAKSLVEASEASSIKGTNPPMHTTCTCTHTLS